MKNNGTIGGIVWIFLYLSFVASTLWMVDRVDENLLSENSSLLGITPILLLVSVFLAERLMPFRQEWNTPDMQTFNHVLYLFSSNYAEVAGRSLTLLAAPFIVSVFTEQGPYQIWPVQAPVFLQIAIGILIHDLVYYWYHRLSHSKTLLWRLHRLHHSIEKLNGLALARFNVIDLMIEFILLTTIIYALGIPETIYLKMSAFMIPATILSHANFSGSLPKSVGWLIISPNSHRIHHSKESELLNKNFGGFTHIWDVVFGTYVEAHKVSVEKVGVADHKTSKWFWKQHLDFLTK